jgi:hypothetical protein
MKAFAVWWCIGFFAFLLWTGNAGVGVLGGFFTWWMTVQIWPRTPCRRCEGAARFPDWATTANWRPCPECQGRGWVPRTFAMGRG